jgi:hypothetical protein
MRGLDSSGSGQAPLAGSCEHGNEPSGPTRGGEFFDHLSEYWLLKKDSAHGATHTRLILPKGLKYTRRQPKLSTNHVSLSPSLSEFCLFIQPGTLKICTLPLTPLRTRGQLCKLFKALRENGKCLSRIRVCTQKFPDWPPGARTANSTALCH